MATDLSTAGAAGGAARRQRFGRPWRAAGGERGCADAGQAEAAQQAAAGCVDRLGAASAGAGFGDGVGVSHGHDPPAARRPARGESAGRRHAGEARTLVAAIGAHSPESRNAKAAGGSKSKRWRCDVASAKGADGGFAGGQEAGARRMGAGDLPQAAGCPCVAQQVGGEQGDHDSVDDDGEAACPLKKLPGCESTRRMKASFPAPTKISAAGGLLA